MWREWQRTAIIAFFMESEREYEMIPTIESYMREHGHDLRNLRNVVKAMVEDDQLELMYGHRYGDVWHKYLRLKDPFLRSVATNVVKALKSRKAARPSTEPANQMATH